ncbi:MAG: sugar ABC transporter substrate-binding protein [Anaerolineales bacterium]|nr:sugar ABC transporter substrate-binding protein [Anaerolineales bacterium]
MKTKKFVFALTLLLVAALTLTACGSADVADPEQPAAEEAPAEEAAEAPAEEEAEAPAEEEAEEVVAEEAEEPAAEEAAEGVSLENWGYELDPAIAEHVANGDPLVIRVSYHDVSNEFAPFIGNGVDQAAEDFNVDVQLVGPVGVDAEAQIAELESLIAAGVDGLAISSVSTDALAPFINATLEMGIPVVSFNSDNPSSNRLAYFGQDMVQAGYQAAKELAERLGGEGKVLITTLDAGAQWSIDRETGARNAFAEYEGIEVLATINCGTEPQEIYSNIENAMLTYPEVNGLLGLECCTHGPAGEYLVNNDMVGEVMIIGFDLVPQVLELVQDGVNEATFDAAPERQSYEAIKQLINFLNGESISNYDTGLQVVDRTNIEEFMSR